MLVAKSIICILTFIALFGAHMAYENKYKRTLVSNILAGIAGVLCITFCVLLITTNCNLFTIPKILLFVSVCLYISFFKKDLDAACVPFWIGIGVTVISFVVTGVMYLNNFEKCEVPDISITNCTVICAKDNSSLTGSMSGGILYVHGSVSEEAVYKYYYQIEDGGIKQGTIPVDSTTIYFVKPGEEAHLETIITTEYWMDNNNTPATRCDEISKTTYKLYVPEGSVTNVYEFDAE